MKYESSVINLPVHMEVSSLSPEGDINPDHARMICSSIYRIRWPPIFSMIIFWTVCIVCTVTNELSTACLAPRAAAKKMAKRLDLQWNRGIFHAGIPQLSRGSGVSLLQCAVSLPFLLSSLAPLTPWCRYHCCAAAVAWRISKGSAVNLWAPRICLDKAHRLFLPRCWRVMNQQTGRRSRGSPGSCFLLGLTILSSSR